jgi:hypothetical protein
MITRDEAERIAAEVIGFPSDDAAHGWDLEEFDEGCLINDRESDDYRGGASRVIERDSGKVMRFPSSVPPTRILGEYGKILGRGRPEAR